MSKWIDRMATFDPKDSMRSDKVAFYFTEAGLLQCSVDGKTTLTIPFQGTTVITATGTRTITGADNGTTFFVNSQAAVTFALPLASVKMKIDIVNLASDQTAAHILDPQATDTIKGPTIGAGTLGANVLMLDTGLALPFQRVTVASDGVLTWWATGTGLPPTVLMTTGKAKAKADEDEKDEKPRLRSKVEEDDDDEKKKIPTKK